MAGPWRQVVGVFGALVVLLGMGLLGQSLRSKLYSSARQEAIWEARQLSERASNEVSLKAREMEARVAAAASLNQVRALVAHSVDRATVVDAFTTEDWWRSARDEFPIQLLATQGARVSFGREPASPDLDVILAAARQKSPVSQLLLADDKPCFAAAALIDVPVPTQRRPSFLVLARPFVGKDLPFAPNFSGAAILAVEKIGLFRAGAPDQLQRLQEMLGEDPSEPKAAPDASWSAAAVEVAPKLLVWVRADTSGKSQEVARTARTILLPLWSIAAALALASLYVGFRRGRRPDEWSKASPDDSEKDKVIVAPELRQESDADLRAALGLPAPAPQPILLSAVPPVTTDLNQFGRYRLLHVLGEGSTMRADLGVLRGAEGFSRLFVIKRLRPELARQPSAVAEFVERAQLGSSLVHSNIVPIYDFGRINDEYFIAQEHILGRDLQMVLQRLTQNEGKQFQPVVVFYIAQEILKALAYAHTRRNARDEPAPLVHGNISPTKILISAMGEVKLLDFGIPHGNARLGGARAYKAAFLSPEQAREEPLDARADLFSLGMTIFWCLTGRIPYSKAEQELLEKVKVGPAREERDLIGVLGGAATYVLQRSLESQPARRFQTAEEFARAIPPWETSRAGERLHSLMRRLFEEDFREEQARYADWQNGLDELSISESPPQPGGEVRRIGQSR